MWVLGGRGIYASVNTFKGDTKIHLRKYAKSPEDGTIHPTKTGITLNPSEWATLLDCMSIIDGEVKRLETTKTTREGPSTNVSSYDNVSFPSYYTPQLNN